MRLAFGVVLCLVVGGCGTAGTSADLITAECGGASDGAPPGIRQIWVRPLATDSLPRFGWAAIAEHVSYPEFAWRTGQEATIPVDVIVDSTGAARVAHVQPDDLPVLLVEAAEAGVASARFVPAPDHLVSVRLFVRFSLLPPDADSSAVVRL